MEIILNGEARSIAADSNLGQLIEALALANQAVAIAVNRQVISRPLWSQHQLQAQDQVDVVRAIGGG